MIGDRRTIFSYVERIEKKKISIKPAFSNNFQKFKKETICPPPSSNIILKKSVPLPLSCYFLTISSNLKKVAFHLLHFGKRKEFNTIYCWEIKKKIFLCPPKTQIEILGYRK